MSTSGSTCHVELGQHNMDKADNSLMRCTLRRVFLLILTLLFLIFLGFVIFFIYLIMSGESTSHNEGSFVYSIRTQWNGQAIDHEPVQIKLQPNSSFLEMHVSAPYFNDPPLPDQAPGPFPKLYDYEVAEAFFLNSETNEYLEVELSPKSYHLVLMLRGYKNAFKTELPLNFQAKIDGSQWSGVAYIPADYFPPKVDHFNAYAIHGSGDERVYEALYPVTDSKFTDPDFHRLEYFKSIAFKQLMPGNYQDDYSSSYWT